MFMVEDAKGFGCWCHLIYYEVNKLKTALDKQFHVGFGSLLLEMTLEYVQQTDMVGIKTSSLWLQTHGLALLLCFLFLSSCG